MNDRDKTKDQLLAELAELRKRLADVEAGTGEMAPADPRWQSLAANTPLLILILDRQHHIRFINHADVAGSPDGVVGKPPYEF